MREREEGRVDESACHAFIRPACTAARAGVVLVEPGELPHLAPENTCAEPDERAETQKKQQSKSQSALRPRRWRCRFGMTVRSNSPPPRPWLRRRDLNSSAAKMIGRYASGPGRTSPPRWRRRSRRGRQPRPRPPPLSDGWPATATARRAPSLKSETRLRARDRGVARRQRDRVQARHRRLLGVGGLGFSEK